MIVKFFKKCVEEAMVFDSIKKEIALLEYNRQIDYNKKHNDLYKKKLNKARKTLHENLCKKTHVFDEKIRNKIKNNHR